MASDWREMAAQAAVRVCPIYGVSHAWASTIADCSLGIIAVESKFGKSPRYRARKTVLNLLCRSRHLPCFASRAQGIAQIDQSRVKYLTENAELDNELDVWTDDGAVIATALGLAKAISLLYPDQTHCPSRLQAANILITHNAGWLAPRIARLQEVLVRLGWLAADIERSGFVGSRTLIALDSAARHLDCPSLSDTILAEGISAPPAWGLTHPDLLPFVYQSDLFESLQHSAQGIGENLNEPRFPDYRIRRWYTGWISSVGYARTVFTHADLWRKKSSTNLGGSSSSKAR